LLDLYGKQKFPCPTLDKLRYILASTTDRSAAQLPPTKDAFEQHVKRARYQVAMWCRSHDPNPEAWNPDDNGWELSEDGHLQPVMYTKESAPKEVRNLTHLYCTDEECTIQNKCQCIQIGLVCTEFCTCFGHDSCHMNVKMMHRM